MSVTIPPNIFQSSIPTAAFAEHDSPPSPSGLRRVAHSYNQTSLNRRKLLHCMSHSSVSTPAPGSSSEVLLYFPFRTGENVASVDIWIGLAPASASSGSAAANCQLSLLSDVSTVSSAKMYYPRVASGTYFPSDVSWLREEITIADGLVANKAYTGYITQNHFSRIHSVMVYEKAGPIADSSVVGVADPLNWETNKPIYDAAVQDLAQTGTKLWQHNACQILSWSRRKLSQAPTIVGTAWQGLIRNADSAWAALNPGFNISTQYHKTHSGNVPVEFAARIRRTAGAGDLDIELVQDGSTLLSTTFSGTGTTPHARSSHTIVAHAPTKTDILCRCSTADTTYEIDCIGLWEYES